MQILATQFGRYLGMDNATLNWTRALGARICVEVDLSIELVQGFPLFYLPLSVFGKMHDMKKTRFYCHKCFRQEHTFVVCRVGERRKADVQRKEKQI